MSKYIIRHTCGHVVAHQLYGTNAKGQRENKVRWLAERLCKDCYRKEQYEEAVRQTAHLPPLTGSLRKVTWATTLRANSMTDLLRLRSKVIDGDYMDRAHAGLALQIITDELMKTEADYWIDGQATAYTEYWLSLRLHEHLSLSAKSKSPKSTRGNL